MVIRNRQSLKGHGMNDKNLITTEELNTEVDSIIQNAEKSDKIKKRTKSLLGFILEVAIWCAVIVVAINVFFRFFKFPQVHGSSMEPTYHDEEVLFARVTTNVSHGDIVVIWSDELNEYLIKRVIGVAGDHIEIRDNTLIRNGATVTEDYINEPVWAENVDIDITVPEDSIYVLGDNRNHSADSRALGSLPVKNIYGKVIGKANWAKRFVNSK